MAKAEQRHQPRSKGLLSGRKMERDLGSFQLANARSAHDQETDGTVMLNVDSGADRHLLKPKDITKRRKASKGSVEWSCKGYQSAASCEGYAEFNLGKGKNSVDIEAHAWGVADVTTRLLSVQRLVADGVDVHFSKSGSYLDFTKVGGGHPYRRELNAPASSAA
ncbi:hypothetical protein T492DRAFT_1029779, partial [Pavlovales sp. CCMP2436]